MNPIIKQSVLFGLYSAIALSLLLTSAFTLWNWVENPGGIFHDASGTNWRFVYDTAESWFFPAFAYVFVAASVLHLILDRAVTAIKLRRAGSKIMR